MGKARTSPLWTFPDQSKIMHCTGLTGDPSPRNKTGPVQSGWIKWRGLQFFRLKLESLSETHEFGHLFLFARDEMWQYSFWADSCGSNYARDRFKQNGVN